MSGASLMCDLLHYSKIWGVFGRKLIKKNYVNRGENSFGKIKWVPNLHLPFHKRNKELSWAFAP